jgi:hypothetical protein
MTKKPAVCVCCGESWPVLPDGTLVEHPTVDHPYFLCSGSRTKARPGQEDGDRTSPVPRHAKPVPSAN